MLFLSQISSIMGPVTADRHTIKLPHIPLKEHLNTTPTEVAEKWVDQFNSALNANDLSNIERLFHQECWWRDTLALSWDFRTVHNLQNVVKFLEEYLSHSQLQHVKVRTGGAIPPFLLTPSDGLDWIQAMFDFETKVGKGTGVLCLVQDTDREWKAFIISTQ